MGCHTVNGAHAESLDVPWPQKCLDGLPLRKTPNFMKTVMQALHLKGIGQEA